MFQFVETCMDKRSIALLHSILYFIAFYGMVHHTTSCIRGLLKNKQD